MPVSTERYRATDISGNYAAFATALGGYGERVTDPNEIVPAIKRGIEKTKQGHRCCCRSLRRSQTKTSMVCELARYPSVYRREMRRSYRLGLRVGVCRVVFDIDA